MPFVQFYYLGDNGNAPYGSKSEEEILFLTRSALKTFENLGMDAVVLACNTATAVCADTLRKEFSFPIVGMEPAVSLAAFVSREILVLCTPQTAKSKRLAALLARFPDRRFVVHPAPFLAGSIEKHLVYGENFCLYDHLPPFQNQLTTPDPNRAGVVLGCTHYLYFKQDIANFYRLPVFDGNEGTAKRLKNLLNSGNGDHLFPCSAQALDPRQNRCDLHDLPYFDKNFRAIPPVFLGEWSDYNEKTYKTNICFQNFL